ncbi:MAG: FapA family protein [Tepidisphaeraceae bacterium]|jgi:uncharacterized protein (DUF342 family)
MNATVIQEPAAAHHVKGSVDLSLGNLDCEGDLVVDDNILDGREVRAAGSVRVAGVIQAAIVHAGGDLRALGGITGRDKADCRAGGEIHARYIVKAKVQADGDVHVETEILNSQISCRGSVAVKAGAISGGRVSAVGNVLCRKLGCHNAITVVEAGVDSATEHIAATVLADIESRRQRAAKIRQTVEPLLKNQKSLTPQQKEKATEILFESDGIAAEAARMMEALRDRCRSNVSPSSPEIRVLGTAYPGVSVRLGDLQTSLETAFAGPFSIVVRGAGADKRIVIIDDGGGVIELNAHPVTSGGAKIVRQLCAS